MTTALRSVEHPADQSRSVLSNGRASVRPRARLFGGMNFGPRFTEDFISVQRNDSDELRKDFYLYYRIYNPTSIRSSESPPLLIVHGGP